MTQIGTLHIYLNSLPHPYFNQPDADYDLWGRIQLGIEHSNMFIPLLDWQWDLLGFSEWFLANQQALLTEQLIVIEDKPLPHESIPQATYRMLNRDVFQNRDDEDYWFDTLYDYRTRHALHSALRGAAIPDVFVGLNHGSGEIALEDAWSYHFDMLLFCAECCQEIYHLLSQVEVEKLHQGAAARAKDIMQALTHVGLYGGSRAK